MHELNNDSFETYNLPPAREFSPKDVDRTLRKLGGHVAHISVKVLEGTKETPIEVRHAISDLDSGTVIDN